MGLSASLAAVGAQLEGIVVDPSGKPLPGTAVRALKPPDQQTAGSPNFVETSSDAGGAFHLDVPGSGPFVVRADHPRFAARLVAKVAPGKTLTLRMSPGLAIDGQVFDARTSRPLAGAEILVLQAEGGSFSDPDRPELFARSAKTAKDGRFRVDRIAIGRWLVQAVAEGHARDERLLAVAGPPAPPLPPTLFYLDIGSSVSGVVSGPAGKPAAWARVWIYPSGSTPGMSKAARLRQSIPFPRAVTDDRGRFVLRGVPEASEYTVYRAARNRARHTAAEGDGCRGRVSGRPGPPTEGRSHAHGHPSWRGERPGVGTGHADDTQAPRRIAGWSGLLVECGTEHRCRERGLALQQDWSLVVSTSPCACRDTRT